MKSGERVYVWLLLALSIMLLIVQARGLFTTPVFDSYLWWGDESWLMFEFRQQMQSGIFRHPFALGSTLAHGSGYLFSNMWITALLYGGAAIAFCNANIVSVGRIVTMLASIGLLTLLYAALRRMDTTRTQALLGVLLLETSLSFFFTSHSSRYDILSSLAILAAYYWMLRKSDVLKMRTAVAVGALTSLTLLVTVHVLILVTLPLLLYVLYRSPGKRFAAFGGYAVGAAITGLVLYGVYFLVNSGQPAVHSNFALNMREVPAFRLFSRSVQFANLEQKTAMLGRYAPMVLLAFTLAIVLLIATRRKLLGSMLFVWLIVAGLVSWTLLESSAPSSYVIYVLPLMILFILKALPSEGKHLSPIICFIAGLVIAAFSTTQVIRAGAIGARISDTNRSAVAQALDSIAHDSISGKPVVLAFSPAVNVVALDTATSLMTTQFIEYAVDSLSAADICQRYHVRYLMTYASALKPDYMREVTPLRQLAESRGTLMWQRAGILTDIGRNYVSLDTLALDTLKLYRLHD